MRPQQELLPATCYTHHIQELEVDESLFLGMVWCSIKLGCAQGKPFRMIYFSKTIPMLCDMEVDLDLVPHVNY